MQSRLDGDIFWREDETKVDRCGEVEEAAELTDDKGVARELWLEILRLLGDIIPEHGELVAYFPGGFDLTDYSGELLIDAIGTLGIQN